MPPRENARRRPRREPPPPQDPSAAKQKVAGIVTDRRVSTESRRAARQLHKAGCSLAIYYRGHPPLAIPLAEYLELQATRRWAA